MPAFYKPGTRKGNRTYVIRGYVDGRQHEITTDARDKAGAEDAWADFKSLVRAQRGQNVTAQTATFADAVDMYVAAKKLSGNDRRYVAKLKRALGDRMLYDVTPGLISKVAMDLYPDAQPQTINRQGIRPGAAIMHHAHDLKLCEWMRFKTLRENDPKRPLAYPLETIRLARQARGPLRVLLITFAHQGWRVTETINFRREWHDAENCRVRRWVSKSRKWKWAALHPVVSAFWKQLPEREDGYLFPWRDRHDVYDALRDMGTDWRPHEARRGFATTLIESGADLKSVMVAGQWEDIKSVLVYADANLEQARRTIGRIRGKTRGEDREAI